MTVAHTLTSSPDPSAIDHFVYLRATFQEYKALIAMRGESSVPRVTYLKGVLELMSPSTFHEKDKTRLARLLEAWAEETGVELEGYGSWTLEDENEDRGAEPDECYTIGRQAKSDDDRPDIAIEVVWTSGGVNKLEVYRKLGVREVWFYERSALRFFALRGDTYAEIPKSEFLPALDPALIVRCMAEASQTEAVRALRASFRR